MSILYNNGIPAAANNPSDDQPDMQTNTDAIDQIIGIDHISFNVGAGNTSGYHKQVTFNNKNVPGAQTDPTSTLYTNNGSASSVSQLLYRNQNAILPVSAIRAFGTLIPSVGTLTNSFNCTFGAYAFPTLTITLTANATTGNNVVVLLSSGFNGNNSMSYSYTNPTLTITLQAGGAGNQLLSFVVLQF